LRHWGYFLPIFSQARRLFYLLRGSERLAPPTGAEDQRRSLRASLGWVFDGRQRDRAWQLAF